MTTSKQTKQDKVDNELILYRLKAVEDAVKDLSSLVAKQDNIKRSDLLDFKSAIIERINEVSVSLQKQIDEKAEKQELADFKKIVFAVIAFAGSIFSAIVLWLITTRK